MTAGRRPLNELNRKARPSVVFWLAGMMLAVCLCGGCDSHSQPSDAIERVHCRSPTGRKPQVVNKWKFDAIRAAILDALAEKGEIEIRQLPGLVDEALPPEKREVLGSLNYFTETVRLEMEVRKELVVDRDVSPARISLPKEGGSTSSL